MFLYACAFVSFLSSIALVCYDYSDRVHALKAMQRLPAHDPAKCDQDGVLSHVGLCAKTRLREPRSTGHVGEVIVYAQRDAT